MVWYCLENTFYLKLEESSSFKLRSTASEWQKYWLSILLGCSGIEVTSYHGCFLNGAKTVDENVHSVFHRNSWIQKKKRKEEIVVVNNCVLQLLCNESEVALCLCVTASVSMLCKTMYVFISWCCIWWLNWLCYSSGFVKDSTFQSHKPLL